MQLDRDSLSRLLSDSIRSPRSAARQLLALKPGMELALPSMAATACLSAILTTLVVMTLPMPMDPAIAGLLSQPLLLAGMQALGLMVTAALVVGVGRVFGGRGRLAEALFLLSWADVVLLVAEVALSLFSVLLPGAGSLLSLPVLAFTVWLVASFIAELHGFKSTRNVAFAIVGTLVLVFAAMSALAPPM